MNGTPALSQYLQPLRLAIQGVELLERSKNSGSLVELEEGINILRNANGHIPTYHPIKVSCLIILGISFFRRFERLGDVTDLDEAISTQQHAVHLTPDGHPDKSRRLANLGNLFAMRTRSPPDTALLTSANPSPRVSSMIYVFNAFNQATCALSQSAQSHSGPPSVRFRSARQWAYLCFSVRSSEALKAYSVVANLLPRVVWLGRTVEQRYTDISGMGDAMADAVHTAIHFSKLNLALEWMEQGRSIVWGQMLQLRTPLDELHEYHPDEATSLENISRALDSAAVSIPYHFDPLKDGASQSLADVAQAHRRLAEEYERTLVHIRDLPGFSEFLLPKQSASLCRAATSGPVITVNAHKARCDALIVFPHSSQVSHVPLPALQLSVVQDMRLQLVGLMRQARHYCDADEELFDILGRLWSYVVEPILCHLKVSHFTLCACFEGIDHAYSCSESLCTGRCRT